MSGGDFSRSLPEHGRRYQRLLGSRGGAGARGGWPCLGGIGATGLVGLLAVLDRTRSPAAAPTSV